MNSLIEDYKNNMYSMCKKEYTEDKILKIKKLNSV